jgi:hypothetical protein
VASGNHIDRIVQVLPIFCCHMRDSSKTWEKFLVFSVWRILPGACGGFPTEKDRGKLVALVRDGSAASRVTRRANDLVVLDGGWSCQEFPLLC